MSKALRIDYAELSAYNEKEILRYAGVRGQADEGTKSLLAECLRECEGVFSYRVCYRVLPKTEFLRLVQGARESVLVCERLKNADEALLFTATVGLGIDRLIARYASVSPSKALLFQAVGAERIEALCDRFCKEQGVSGRFSPGYGDFPLAAQRDIFEVLKAAKTIGVALTDSLMMSPTKSVTAVAALS